MVSLVPSPIEGSLSSYKLNRYVKKKGFSGWNVDGKDSSWYRYCEVKDDLYDPHAHSCSEVLFVREGTLKVTAGDETITATKGDIIIVDAGVEHREHGDAKVVLFTGNQSEEERQREPAPAPAKRRKRFQVCAGTTTPLQKVA